MQTAEVLPLREHFVDSVRRVKQRIKEQLRFCLDLLLDELDHEKEQISKVAHFLGYSRLHEFSREFSRYFHVSPSNIPPQHITKKNRPVRN